MNISDRIIQYLDYKTISKNKFYINTGLSNGFLDKKPNIGADKIELIIEKYPDINLYWLITGKGEMLKPPKTKHIDQVDKMVSGSSNETERIYKELLKEKELKIDELKEEIWRLKEKVKTLENKHHKPSLHNSDKTLRTELEELIK